MKLRAVKAILWKDLKEMSREKMVLFWVLLFPMMWLLVMGGIWGHTSPPVTVKVGTVYFDEGAAGIVSGMSNVTMDGRHLFNVKVCRNESAALNALTSGKLDAVVLFPRGFGKNLSIGYPATVVTYYDKSDPQEYQIARGVVGGFFSEFSKRLAGERVGVLERYVPGNVSPLIEGVAEPIALKEKSVSGTQSNPVLFFLAGVIGIQFLFATMSLAGSGTLKEIEHGTLRRIAASPATAWDFLIGKLLSTSVVIFGSIVGLILFSRLVFGATIWPGPAGWFLILVAGAFSMGLGLAIAMLTRSIRATNAAINMVSWPLMFLAGIVVPPSTLPGWAQPIVNYFPLGRALKDFRLIEIYRQPTGGMVGDMLWLSAVSLGMVALAVLAYNWAVKRLE